MKKYKFFFTNDAVAGDTIKFKEAVFAGSYRKPKFIGYRVIVAKITKESYGSSKQQHTFNLEVIRSMGVDSLAKGAKIRRKGRNIYKYGAYRLDWKAEESKREKLSEEKHERGDKARAARQRRKEGTGGFISW